MNIEKNITIRIRELPYGDKKLQIKLKKNNYSSLFVTKEEMEFDVQDITDSLDLSIYPELKKMGLGEVRYIGKLVTDRLICKKEFCTLMIDKNHYLGHLDFELEIEFETQFETRAMSEIQQLGLNVDSKTLGEFKRFLDKYGYRSISWTRFSRDN